MIKMKKITKKLLIGGLSFLLTKGVLSQTPAFLSDITGSYSTSLNSHTLIPPVGFLPGVGPHNQHYFELNKDKLTAYVWATMDIGKHTLGKKGEEYNEVDFAIIYNEDLIKKLNLSGKIEIARWIFTGGADNCITFGLNYSGPFDASLNLYTLLEDYDMGSGTSLQAKASKSFNIDKVEVTPSLFACQVNNFYGVTGLSNIVANIGVAFPVSDNLSVSGNLSHQWKGNVSSTTGIKDQTFGSVGINYNFLPSKKQEGDTPQEVLNALFDEKKD